MPRPSDHRIYEFFLMKLSRAAWSVVQRKLDDDQHAEFGDLDVDSFELLLRNELQKRLNVQGRTVREWFQNEEKCVAAGYIILVAHLFDACRELGQAICNSRDLFRRALRETAVFVRDPDDAIRPLSEDEILVLILACRCRANQVAEQRPTDWNEICKFVFKETKLDYGIKDIEQLLNRWIDAIKVMIDLFPFLRSGPL